MTVRAGVVRHDRRVDNWDALQRTPIPELQRRAALIEMIDDFLEPSPVENGLFVWEDGGGQNTAWQFSDDGRVLLLTYEHEGLLNVINEELIVQRGFYDGVPTDLMELVLRDSAATGFIDFSDESLGTLLVASGVFWFDGDVWHIAEGLTRYCAENDVYIGESGFDYCTRPYLLGQDFTADTYYQKFALMDWMKEPERAELRRTIDAGFAAYGE